MTHTEHSVTFLSTSLAYGGAANQIAQLAVRLKRRGWRTNIISITPPVAFAGPLAEAGVPLETLGVRGKASSLTSLPELFRLLGQHKPQLLHTHLVHANLLGRLSRPFHRLPLISTIHSINEGGRHREHLYRLTDRLSDATTIISERAAEQHLRRGVVSPGRARVVPNGVDLRAFTPQGTNANVRRDLGLGDAPLLLTVGRFVAAKDYPNLFAAFKRVAERYPDAVLLVVGTGELGADLHRLVGSLNLTGSVRFLGTRTDIPALMNAADLFVMASAWEGLPMVLLEAAACALPVVSTDVGGVSEVVIDAQTGLLAPPKDPHALAEAVLKLLGLPDSERRALGERARRHAETRFDFESVTDTWEQLYLGVLEQRRPERTYGAA